MLGSLGSLQASMSLTAASLSSSFGVRKGMICQPHDHVNLERLEDTTLMAKPMQVV